MILNNQLEKFCFCFLLVYVGKMQILTMFRTVLAIFLREKMNNLY